MTIGLNGRSCVHCVVWAVLIELRMNHFADYPLKKINLSTINLLF